ncbi:hypothetical protein NC653_013013 [Populus alba x Populus x berolinensis]|uniref:Uncharacterized protein n=1 Tax=Populus alba x Populus x berolinensis TaxID=444605 RepID=A0AAD6QTC2_9ROSI|nr:hypothetical protein NC653_013013 [Populus alba x Populus x berolinensis]
MLSLKKFSSHVFIFVDIICLGFWVYCNDRFQRGLKRKPMALIKKLRKAVSELTLWDVFSFLNLFTLCLLFVFIKFDLQLQSWCSRFGFAAVEKGDPRLWEAREPLRTHLRNMITVPGMSCDYLAGFSVSYKPVMHGRPGNTPPDSFLSSEMGHLIRVAVDFSAPFFFL